MFRRGLLVVAGLVVASVLVVGFRAYSVTTGTAFGAKRTHECGTPFGVFFADKYEPGLEGSFVRRRCGEAATNRIVNLGLLTVLGLGAAVAGIIRGPRPPYRSINELTPLPTREEMRRDRLSAVRDVDGKDRG